MNSNEDKFDVFHTCLSCKTQHQHCEVLSRSCCHLVFMIKVTDNSVELSKF